LDDAAATILARLIERRGARPLSWIDASPTNLALVNIEGIQMVCLVYLNENSLAHARYSSGDSDIAYRGSLPTAESARISAQEATKADAISTSLSRPSIKSLRLGAALRIPPVVRKGKLVANTCLFQTTFQENSQQSASESLAAK